MSPLKLAIATIPQAKQGVIFPKANSLSPKRNWTNSDHAEKLYAKKSLLPWLQVPRDVSRIKAKASQYVEQLSKVSGGWDPALDLAQSAFSFSGSAWALTDDNRALAVFDEGKLKIYDFGGILLQEFDSQKRTVEDLWSLPGIGFLVRDGEELWILPVQKVGQEAYQLVDDAAGLKDCIAVAADCIAMRHAHQHNILKVWHADSNGHFKMQPSDLVVAPPDAKLSFVAQVGDCTVGISKARRGYDLVSFASVISRGASSVDVIDLGHAGEPLFFQPWDDRYAAYGNSVIDTQSKRMTTMDSFQALLLGAFPFEHDKQMVTHIATPLHQDNGRYSSLGNRLEFFQFEGHEVRYSGSMTLDANAKAMTLTKLLFTSKSEFVAIFSSSEIQNKHKLRRFVCRD